MIQRNIILMVDDDSDDQKMFSSSILDLSDSYVIKTVDSGADAKKTMSVSFGKSQAKCLIGVVAEGL